MSNLQQAPLVNGQRAERRGGAAPLSREYLDTSRRPMRVLAGAAFVAYSSIGTILGVQGDLAPALASRDDSAILGYGIGVVVAVIIFVAELLLAEVSLWWYLVVLVPDVYYTYRFSGWIGAIVHARVADAFAAQVATVIITGLFSLAVAYFGERLLFGRRR
jgi:hypothetical protein